MLGHMATLTCMVACVCLMSFAFANGLGLPERRGGRPWPMWVKLQKPVLELFETMQPFQDEDDYDVAKAWGISVPQQFNLNCFTSVDDV